MEVIIRTRIRIVAIIIIVVTIIMTMLNEITPVGLCYTSSFRINLHRHAALTWCVIEMHPAVQDGPKLQREVAVNLLHFMVQELIEPDQVGRTGSIGH